MNLLQPCRGLGSRGHSFARRKIFRLLGAVLCLLAVGLQPLPGATVVNPPYLQNLGADHVTIVWAAKENQPASVQFSTDGSFSKSIAAHLMMKLKGRSPPLTSRTLRQRSTIERLELS